MKALVWHGKEDVRYDTVSDLEIEDDRDAIIKVTSCAICGSDLHLFHNLIPVMLPGDILGHETMGEVVEAGSAAKGSLKKGDRVVIPFTIQCGECDQCRRGNFSVCERTNRKKELADKAFGHATAGLFGYGARELASAVQTLSIDKPIGLASRIAGDALDLGTLATGLKRDNPQRRNAAIATALVAGITLLDLTAFFGVKAAHKREPASGREYSDRSGLPHGPLASRGLARQDFETPSDYRSEVTVADAVPALAG